MLAPLVIGGGLVLGLVFLMKRNKPVTLQPGMTGLLNGTKLFGMVVLRQNGVLGWTNVQPSDNQRVRSEFPNGTRTFIRPGPEDKGTIFHVVADGDGIQGGRFFRAL